MNNRSLIILVIILSVLVALAGTNPTTIDYGVFLQAELSRALERSNAAESSHERRMIRDLMTAQGKRVIESLIHTHTVRHNYGLFSIFETRAFDVRLVVIGAGKRFVPVEGQEEIAKKLGQLIL